MEDLMRTGLSWFLKNYGSYIAMGVLALLGGGMLLGGMKRAAIKLLDAMLKLGDEVANKIIAKPRAVMLIAVFLGIAIPFFGLGRYVAPTKIVEVENRVEIPVDRQVVVEVPKEVIVEKPTIVEKTITQFIERPQTKPNAKCWNCNKLYVIPKQDYKERMRCSECNYLTTVKDSVAHFHIENPPYHSRYHFQTLPNDPPAKKYEPYDPYAP